MRRAIVAACARAPAATAIAAEQHPSRLGVYAAPAIESQQDDNTMTNRYPLSTSRFARRATPSPVCA